MGNYCSSGQNKKDKDNLSQKSEEYVPSFRIKQNFPFFLNSIQTLFTIYSSPTYQKQHQGGKSKKDKEKIKNKDKHYLKEAPLVDPEPTSDISNFNAPANFQNTINGNIANDGTKSTVKALQTTLSAYGKLKLILKSFTSCIRSHYRVISFCRLNIRQPVNDRCTM